MGIFKKVFKGIGKVFKGIGKTIKKGFQKFGKFMNKLGIFGQVGMMFIMPSIAGFAMKGLMQLGSGFMTGLASAGWTTTATGISTATPGIMGGAARVSHAIFTTAAKVAQGGMDAYRTITDTITGVVKDTAIKLGNKMGLTEKMVPIINPVTGLPEATTGEAGSIFKNIASRFEAGATKTWGSLTDAAKVVGDIMPGGAEYIPRYEKFKMPTGEATKKGLPKFEEVTKEVNYSTENMDAYTASLKEGPPAPLTASKTNNWDKLKTAAVGVAATKAIQYATKEGKPEDWSRSMSVDSSEQLYGVGSEVRLADTTFDARKIDQYIDPYFLDYASIVNDSFFDGIGQGQPSRFAA